MENFHWKCLIAIPKYFYVYCDEMGLFTQLSWKRYFHSPINQVVVLAEKDDVVKTWKCDILHDERALRCSRFNRISQTLLDQRAATQMDHFQCSP